MRAHRVAPEIGKDFTVLEKAGLKITAITVDHAPVAPAVGYRFDYAGRSVVISGDTVYSKNLERASKGVDLLVHEVLQKAIIGSVSQAMADRGIDRLSKLSGDILEYHTSPAEAVRLAREAGVRNLVFNHIVPPLPDRLARWIFFQDIGDPDDCGLARGVDPEDLSSGEKAADRCGVDDVASRSLLDQSRDEGLAAVDHPVHVHAKQPAPIIVARFVGAAADADSGVVAHQVFVIVLMIFFRTVGVIVAMSTERSAGRRCGRTGNRSFGRTGVGPARVPANVWSGRQS